MLLSGNARVSGESANRFVVGLTNELAQENEIENMTLTVTLWNYTVCGQYPGVVPAGATVTVHCPFNLPPRRYVIVQLPRDNGRLHVCEVEVFATSTPIVLTVLWLAQTQRGGVGNPTGLLKLLTYIQPEQVSGIIKDTRT